MDCHEQGIASQTLAVDGTMIAPINGPFGGVNYSCPIGMWAAGGHTYVIQSTDSTGVSASTTGTFNVVAGGGPTIGGVVVAQAKEQILGTHRIPMEWRLPPSRSMTSPCRRFPVLLPPRPA